MTIGRVRASALVAVLALASVMTGALGGTSSASSSRPAVASSTTTSGGWHWKRSHGDVANGLACPSPTLCIGIDGNKVRWTKTPTATKPHWTALALEPSSQPTVTTSGVILDALSCPTAHFCLATDDLGNTFSTTDPTGSKSAWHEADVDEIEILAVSCASASLCAGLDYYGNALTSSDPGAVSPRWSSTLLESSAEGADPLAVSCVGHATCAAVVNDKKIFYTTDATAAPAVWKHVSLAGKGWDGVSCPTTTRCVAVGAIDFGHHVAVTDRLSGGVHTWKTATLRGSSYSEGLYGVDCANSTHCFAIGDEYTTHLAGSASAWHATTLPSVGSQTQVSCATTTWCFVGTSTEDFMSGHR